MTLNPTDLPSESGEVVGTSGLEPLTSCVSSRRSNQLSYAPKSRTDKAYRTIQYSNRFVGQSTDGGTLDGAQPRPRAA